MMREWLGMSVGLLIAVAVFGAPARAQVNFDRPGGDYASFPMRSGDPAQCASRCERDARCRAWAFSYPVTENANAVCWLKSRVMPRLASTCCVSGVRGTESSSRVVGRRSLGSIAPAATIGTSNCQPTPAGRAAERPVKGRRGVGPGRMFGRAMSVLRRFAISRITSRVRCASRAAFREW